MKKLVAFLSVLVIALSIFAGALMARPSVEVTPEGEFVPQIRFAVASDVHVRKDENDDYDSRNNLTMLMKSAYAYSDAQEDGIGLNGIFILGDMTQGGADEEFEDFFKIANEYLREDTVMRTVLGNHEFYATTYDDGTNSDARYSDTSVKNTVERFLQYTGYETEDVHFVLGGYHFIFLSLDKYDKDNSEFYSKEKLEWLDVEITKAVYDDPTGEKPIFVFQHVPPLDTMLGSGATNSDKNLKDILSYYPQVVNFSGHTHRPATDPKIIWQDTFTAINTGSLAYLSLNIAGSGYYENGGVSDFNGTGAWTTSGNYEEAIRNGYMFYVVEIDAKDNIRVNLCDIKNGKSWGDPIMLNVGNPDEFTYTAERKYKALRPIWNDGAEIFVEKNLYGSIIISVPQAYSNVTMQNYRTEVYLDGKLVKKLYSLAGTHYGDFAPDKVIATITDLLPDTEYEIKVYPVNSWGKAGSPLVTKVKTLASPEGENGLASPDILNVVFNSDSTATNSLSGETLKTIGSPEVYFDEEIGMNAAIFDGSSAYVFEDMKNWYPTLGESYSVEAYVYLPAKPSGSYTSILFSNASGGFGFEYKTSGNLCFVAGIGETAAQMPKINAENGKWLHLVGVYDGMEMKLYVNGEKVASTLKIAESLKTPTSNAWDYTVGAASSSVGAERFANCSIASAGIYSYALSDAEIAEIYNALK